MSSGTARQKRKGLPRRTVLPLLLLRGKRCSHPLQPLFSAWERHSLLRMWSKTFPQWLFLSGCSSSSVGSVFAFWVLWDKDWETEAVLLYLLHLCYFPRWTKWSLPSLSHARSMSGASRDNGEVFHVKGNAVHDTMTSHRWSQWFGSSCTSIN